MVTVSAVFGATGLKRRPRAPREDPVLSDTVAASAASAFGAATVTVPLTAAAAVTTAAARSVVRRLTASAMTSPTYGFVVVLGTSWKQASPHRNRQVRAARPPGCESLLVPMIGNGMRMVSCSPLASP